MLRDALETTRATLLPNSIVERVVLSGDGSRAVGVDVIDRIAREKRTIHAHVVVLAASALESVRILFNSHSARHPRGLGNSSGLLGHFVMDHVRTGGVFHSDQLTGVGEDDATWGPVDAMTSSGFLIPPSFLPAPTGTLRRYQIQGRIVASGDFVMLSFGEMLPREQNRVMVDSCLRDAWGIPSLRIDVTFGDNDLALWKRQKQTLEAIYQAIGGRRVMNAKAVMFNFFARKPHIPGSGFHECGGARMGDDPKQSVVSPYNQLWDTPNIVIVDSSVFPTSGFQNPTLTEVALAFRASEHILSVARSGLNQ